jgi:hypothetical protein
MTINLYCTIEVGSAVLLTQLSFKVHPAEPTIAAPAATLTFSRDWRRTELPRSLLERTHHATNWTTLSNRSFH